MSDQNCPHCGIHLKSFQPISFGNVSIHDSGQITYKSELIVLPPAQFLMADALIRTRGHSLTRSALANLVGIGINDSTVTKCIERVRASFRKVDARFSQIESMRGFGAYRWVRGPDATEVPANFIFLQLRWRGMIFRPVGDTAIPKFSFQAR